MASPLLTLIDASNFIFRAYHAIPPLSTSRGVPTNAVYGFTRMMLKTLRELNPSHVALAFDKQSRVGRQEIDPTYKANREATPPDLLVQFDLIRKVVEVLDLPILEFAGWEADDVIGTLVPRARAEGFDVLVVTGDKDFIQVVDDHVRLYDPMHDRHTGPAEVRERLGIEPSQMRDYLALVGDAVDNVAKIPGIGPKTAAELIHQFGTVESLIERLAEVKKPKLREALSGNIELLQRAKKLVTFKTDLPLEVGIGELARRPIKDAAARDLFSELEFFKLLQEMPREAPTPFPSEVRQADSREALQAFAAKAKEQGRIAVVPAFQGLAFGAVLVGLGASFPDGAAWYLPLGHTSLLAKQPTREEIQEILGPVLADPVIKKDGHNLKSLVLLLARRGLTLEGLDGDIEILSYLLNPSRREHALSDLSRERLRCELPPIPGQGSARKRMEALEGISVEEAACHGIHADAVRRLALELWPELKQVGLTRLACELEIPLIPVLARMERKGIRVDPARLSEIAAKVETEMAVQLKEIYRLAGREFNVGSNPQLVQLLFEELKLSVLKRGKTGPSADNEVLEKLAQQHPLPRSIIEHRSLSKLKSTYLDTLPTLIAEDGRIHTTYDQAIAATGRLSSTDPNLQNIPIRTELGRQIRTAFVAEDGNVLISADYSQIELRILAHVTGDPALMDAFQKDQDVHTRTASEVFSVAPEAVTSEHRRAAKAINFAIAYGLSPHGLSTRLDISTIDAKGIIDRYFERYTGIRRYLDETIELARKKGYVETLFGRRRWIPELGSRNRNIAQAAERAAINMPIQGTAADLIKMAMLRVDARIREERLRGRMLLQVHDELLFEAPKEEAERLVAITRECMAKVAEFRVPLKVDVGQGRSWGEAH